MHDPAVSGEEPPSDSGLSRGLSGKVAALSIPVVAVRRALYFFSPSFSASISAFICASSSSTPLCEAARGGANAAVRSAGTLGNAGRRKFGGGERQPRVALGA